MSPPCSWPPILRAHASSRPRPGAAERPPPARRDEKRTACVRRFSLASSWPMLGGNEGKRASRPDALRSKRVGPSPPSPGSVWASLHSRLTPEARILLRASAVGRRRPGRREGSQEGRLHGQVSQQARGMCACGFGHPRARCAGLLGVVLGRLRRRHLHQGHALRPQRPGDQPLSPSAHLGERAGHPGDLLPPP